MYHFYWLQQIQPNHQGIVGDRFYYLSYLMRLGHPIIPGFVVPASMFWQFLETVDWLAPLFTDLPASSLHFDVNNSHQLQVIAQSIRYHIKMAALSPELLSLLEDAAEQLGAKALSFRPTLASPRLKTSGLLESQICYAEPQAMAMGLKQAWAELFRARSLFYWRRSGIKLQQLNPAILIQPMAPAIASGSVEVHPQNWKIQATCGLGLSLLRGETLPDTYQVEGSTRQILQQQMGQKLMAYNLNLEYQKKAKNQPPGFSVPTPYFLDSWHGVAMPVDAYILSEEKQEQYALDPESLQNLMQVTQNVIADLGKSLQLEWTLCNWPGNAEPQLFITEVYPLQEPVTSPKSSATAAIKPQRLISQPQNARNPLKPLTAHHPTLIRGFATVAGKILAKAWVVTHSQSEISCFVPGDILVASAILPKWLPFLKDAAGVITEQGGITGHGAILARELGIPAVVGVADATHLIKTGDFIWIDGDQGIVSVMNEPQMTIPSPNLTPPPPSSIPHSHSPIATQLFVNLSQLQSVDQLRHLPIDGVGLLRSELMLWEMLENQLPREWLNTVSPSEFVSRMTQHLQGFAAALKPKPLFYRALDLRDVPPMATDAQNLQPAKNSTLFDLELMVLAQLHQLGNTNVHLILPFVRSVEEFMECCRSVKQAGLTQNPDFQLWIMAEVPSVVFLLPDYIKAGVQGISIGTNDLTQLLLGVSRDQESIPGLDARHPAMMAAMKQLIETARNAGIPCSICGEAPSLYPEMIDDLVRWGITSISVNLDAVESTYAAISRAEHRLILEAARQHLIRASPQG